MKTHSGAKKRFGVTGSGAFTRGHAFRRHLMITKTRGQVNRLGEVSPVHKADVSTARAACPATTAASSTCTAYWFAAQNCRPHARALCRGQVTPPTLPSAGEHRSCMPRTPAGWSSGSLHTVPTRRVCPMHRQFDGRMGGVPGATLSSWRVSRGFLVHAYPHNATHAYLTTRRCCQAGHFECSKLHARY